MGEEKENTIRVNIFLPPDLHKELKVEAKSKGTNVSALVRMILLERRLKSEDKNV